MRSPWKWRAIKPILAGLFLLLAGCRKSGPPYSPSDALKTFQVDPGYRVELFASEPAIVSPIAMTFDENGSVLVVEDLGQNRSRVKLLDGRGTVVEQTGLTVGLVYGLDNQVHRSGEVFDSWGHVFTLTPSEHIHHEAIAARYFKGIPAPPFAIPAIADHQLASARGLLFYNGAMFVADPVHHLVHEDVLSEAGTSYIARRARERVEFLSSSDPWFQPVNLADGPDGALYVVDAYGGAERGRIYRIVPQVADRALAPPARLGAASNRELVHELESPNPWVRRTAQRLLVARNQLDAAPDLARVAQISLSPEGRVHALWTLEGMKKLDAGLIARALDDTDPGVRENAVILAESRLTESPQLIAKLLEMVEDTGPKVRFQLLCTLGLVNTPESRRARARLLAQDSEDRWAQRAAALGLP